MAEDKIDSLLFKEDTILLSLNLDAFNQHFRTYFEHFFKQKEKYVTGIRGVILERLPRINQLLLLNSLETVMFKAGETLVIKNTYLGKLYFDSSAKLTENSSLYKCIGLKELIQGSKLYE